MEKPSCKSKNLEGMIISFEFSFVILYSILFAIHHNFNMIFAIILTGFSESFTGQRTANSLSFNFG